jgi:hypothetical protein
MCCCHGYRHRHHWCPGYEYGPPPDVPYPPYARRGRRTRARDLEDYLEDLEDELTRVRRELRELRELREQGSARPPDVLYVTNQEIRDEP